MPIAILNFQQVQYFRPPVTLVWQYVSEDEIRCKSAKNLLGYTCFCISKISAIWYAIMDLLFSSFGPPVNCKWHNDAVWCDRHIAILHIFGNLCGKCLFAPLLGQLSGHNREWFDIDPKWTPSHFSAFYLCHFSWKWIKKWDHKSKDRDTEMGGKMISNFPC